MSWCPEGAFLVLVLLAVAACGEREREAAGPAQPDDDPAHGVYNYDDARDLGIRVDPVPPADQLCPVGITDDGLSAEELDTREELAALDQGMATAPTCTVDPRLGLIGLGYSVEAVRAAPNAVEKGKLVCGGGAPSIPASRRSSIGSPASVCERRTASSRPTPSATSSPGVARLPGAPRCYCLSSDDHIRPPVAPGDTMAGGSCVPS